MFGTHDGTVACLEHNLSRHLLIESPRTLLSIGITRIAITKHRHY
jgi:hypothetical protein